MNLLDITPSQWLHFLHSCADEADAVTLHYFNKASFKITEKLDMTPVTQADIEAEEKIRNSVRIHYPDLPILGEELGACPEDSSIKLIIDPIDGTKNFIRGIPHYATLLAIEKNGDIIAGLISSKASGNRWWASLGNGSYYNGTRIHVSSIKTLSDSLIFHGSLYGPEARVGTEKLLKLLSMSPRQRGVGDYLMYTMVACGWGECSVDSGLKPWDLAPMAILLNEAGGKVSLIDGSKFTPYAGNIICSNTWVHDEVIRVLNT
jgi:histidinol-phosphatase